MSINALELLLLIKFEISSLLLVLSKKILQLFFELIESC